MYSVLFMAHLYIEIKYAPGGDENTIRSYSSSGKSSIEIKYAPGGDENLLITSKGTEYIN